MKPRFSMPHVPYWPGDAEIFRSGKQAARANRGTVKAKPSLDTLRQWEPLFAQENIETQRAALEIFAEGWKAGRERR